MCRVSGDAGAVRCRLRPSCVASYAFFLMRIGRPEKTSVRIVSWYPAVTTASLCVSGASPSTGSEAAAVGATKRQGAGGKNKIFDHCSPPSLATNVATCAAFVKFGSPQGRRNPPKKLNGF